MNARGNVAGFHPAGPVPFATVPDEVVAIAEIAELLGVDRSTAHRYARRPDLNFPAPVRTLARGRLWDREAVEAWGEEHLPLRPGRPRKRADDAAG